MGEAKVMGDSDLILAEFGPDSDLIRAGYGPGTSVEASEKRCETDRGAVGEAP